MLIRACLGMVFFLLILPTSLAQGVNEYAMGITQKGLKKHLMILASDEYEGRETGTIGQKKAEKYIVDHFKNIGVPPYKGQYTQEFDLMVKDPSRVYIGYGEREFKFLDDFYYYPGGPDAVLDNELVFIGHGIDDPIYSEYTRTDVEGKIVLLYEGEPMSKKGISKLTGSQEKSEWSKKTEKKVDRLSEMGAKGIIYAFKDFDKSVERIKKFFGRKSLSLEDKKDSPSEDVVPVFYCSLKMADYLISNEKALKKFKNKTYKKGPMTRSLGDIRVRFERNSSKVTSSNVLCFIEGSDKKDEIVVITSHYDHIGITDDEINNGADDDGSGTVAALEIAKAFKAAKDEGNGPRRSVLIMPVSGEEKGLLGSKYYTDNPVFPLENTVVDLNIDMIGRYDEAHEGNENYVYLIGSDRLSKELHELSEGVNDSCCQMELDYTYNAEDDPNKFYYRSDHYNFAKNNIPVIFYFSGVHEDYHQPTDTHEKIRYEKLERTARLIFHTAWEIANREERLRLD